MMKKIVAFLAAALLSFSVHAEVLQYSPNTGGGGGGAPTGPAGGDLGSTYPNPLVLNGANITAANAPATLNAITQGLMVDPRQYGATCAGATFPGGTPVQVGSNDDTGGFVAAQFVAAATGGVVMVPDGCWVKNLPMLSGVSLVAQNWAPNYGYDYGSGTIGFTLNVTAGSGYTNGTYLLQTSGAPSGASGFDTGKSITSGTSTTSVTVGTGSKAFTTASRTAQTVGTPIIVYDSTTVQANGAPTNYMFGLVTADTGTVITINVTQTGGSGTIATWNIRQANFIVVAGGQLGTATPSGYNILNAGSGYNTTTTIPVPSAAGAGNGGSIGLYVRTNGMPYAKPVMYLIGNPTYGINVNGSETVAFVGFEVNGFSGSTSANCIGSDSASQGFGGKIWLYQMSVKGCNVGFAGSSGCYDYLVSENSDYAGNTTGIGGCFSDFLSQGDTFASGGTGISGSGGGFARISNDRFEYLTNGIAPSTGFLELDINNTQFDHFNQCAINLGTQWNQIRITGGDLKGGGIDGSLTVTGAAGYSDGQVELTVSSAAGSLNANHTATSQIKKVATVIDTSATSITVGTGAQTFTTVLSDALHSRISSTTGTANAGSTTFTDASQNFGGSYTGDILNITACTGTGCKTGFYRVMSFTSNHNIVLDRTPTDGVHNMTAATYTDAVPLLIYQSNAAANWMYGTVTSDTGTSLVMNITSTGGSGTISNWSFGRPYWINVAQVGGTTEANANSQIFTVADDTHIVLQNSTFANAYTSGGFAGVQTMDADICLGGNSPGNKANQLTLSNVGFDSPKALGQAGGPAYVIESQNQGGQQGDYIGVYGGSAIPQVNSSGVAVNYTAFTIGFENWIYAPPTHYVRDVLGQAKIDTADPTFSIDATGHIGVQTTAPASGLAFDMTQDALGAFGLPNVATVSLPTIDASHNGIVFDATTGDFKGWDGTAWRLLSTKWPSLNSIILSAGVNLQPTGLAEVDGDCVVGAGGLWTAGSCSGSLPANLTYRDISATFDGGSSALTAGKVIYISNIPYGGTITGVTMLADQSCSATIDVWKTTYAGAPPTVANTIVGTVPTLSSAQKYNDTTLTSWSKTITAGDTMAVKLVTSTTCISLAVSLQVTTN